MAQCFHKCIPSLLQLCIQTAIDNVKYIGDVGETDMDLLRQILPHCTSEQLMHIEKSTEGRDLSPVTDELWKRFYELHFGEKSMNIVIGRMKQGNVTFKWSQLYQAQLKNRDKAQERSVERLRKLYAEEGAKKQNRKIRLCHKVPPSKNKRSYFGGRSSDCNGKGSLMKKARVEFLNSHEVKMHQAIRRNALQAKVPSSSISLSSKTQSLEGKSVSSVSARSVSKF